MCWTPRRVTQSRHWPWGLACHGVHLFAPPLCKKNIWGPTAFRATPAKSLHGNRKTPYIAKEQTLYGRGEMSTSAVSMSPV